VSGDIFSKAQAIIRERGKRFTDEELLDQLRSLMEREGRLSGLLIDEREGLPSSSVYRTRFGSPDSGISACRVQRRARTINSLKRTGNCA